MEQLKRILASLSPRQKTAIVFMALLAGAGIYWFAHYKKEAGFKPLYTGLAAEDAAAVVTKLKESGTEYRVSDKGDVVLAPEAKLAELRLDMAAAGLPKTGRIGFEIFDKNTLGSTEFVEHVNFQRALEGELERSVASLAEVETARVHITFPKDSVFLDSREPAKASVLVKLKAGLKLSPRNVAAVTHLVASAVEGLTPDGVSVLDMQGNLLSQPRRSPDEQESEEALDYRQKVERDLAQKVAATLDPLLGHERYRANVSAETEITSGEQEEETLDPARSVMLTSQKTEELVNAPGSAGVPGTASNLPRPSYRSAGSSNSTQRRTENITYQSSRVVKKTKLPRGGLKRLSVAVLLDQGVRWMGEGPGAQRVLTPPTPETMQTVKTLVSTVVGLSPERGDQITVETLPFEATLALPAPGTPAPPAGTAPQQQQQPFDLKGFLKNPKILTYIAGGAMLLLALVGVIWFLKRTRSGAEGPEMARALPAHATHPAIESAEEILQARLAERDELQQRADDALLASIKVPPVKTQKSEVLVKQLRDSTRKDPTPAANVLQEWIHDQ
jgi:flagellar M-ring protein FliF